MVAAAALTGGSLPVFLVSALSPRIAADLALDPATLGTAVSTFFLASAVASIPGGRVADRFGARVALRLGLLLAVVCGLALASLARGAWSLVALLFVGGTSLGLIDTGGARAISARVQLRRQGFAFGAKEASIPTASLLAGVSVPVVAAQFGWRPAFLLAAGFALVIALAVPRRLELVAPPAGSPEHAHHPPDPRSPSPPEEQPPPGGVPTPEPPQPAPAMSRSRSWALVALAVGAGLGGGAASSAATFLVPSSVAFGMAESAAGLLLSVASAVGISARLGVGALADRWLGRELRIVAAMLGLGSLGVLLLATGASTLLVVAGAVLAIGSGWGWTGLVFLSAVRIDPHRPARAAGIVLAGLGSGGAVGPAVFGLVVDRASYAWAWTLGAVTMMLAAMAAVTAYELRRRSANRAARTART